jgi:hypothetical protein
MFPPRAGDCQIIEFSSFAAAKSARQATAAVEEHADGITSHRRARIAKRAAKLLEVTTAPESFTETCRNHRMRLSRRDAWWQADHLTDYWKARMCWHSALSIAQDLNIADANSYPKISGYGEGWSVLVDSWRNALVQQMLTPAPDQNAVNWKLAKLRGRNDYDLKGAKPERLQRAIDADVEWLKSHPSRKSIAATRQAKKGREIAVVATIPEADQQELRATVRQMLQEGEQ